jgi:hypothetical protein
MTRSGRLGRVRGARIPLGFLLLWTAAGCQGDGGQAEPTSVRDSAGVRIVESHAPQWMDAGAWRISSEPQLRIGLSEGAPEYLFSRVAGATRLPDGTIVVGDGQSNQLRYFDPEGRFLSAVGGSGQGPGEFEFMRALRKCDAENIYAFDLSWQTKIFGPGGALKREFRLTDPEAARTPYALSCSRSGEFLITGWGARTGRPPLGFHDAASPVWLLDPDGAMLARIGEFVSSERIGDPTGSRPHPFGRAAVVALDEERLFVGPSMTFEVLSYDRSGQLTEVLRGPPPDLEIRPEHLDRYLEDLVASLGEDARDRVRREVQSMPLPPAFPAYDQMQIDPDGNLWVRRFSRPGDEEGAWWVFDPEGFLLGEVVDVAGLTVVEVGRDYVLGIHEDPLGVERIQLHGLEKGSPARADGNRTRRVP